jgi:hypothetical protein
VLMVVLMVAVVGILLGQCRADGRQQAKQRQNGGSRAHRGNATNGLLLPCTLLLVESQVVFAPPVKPPSRSAK